MRVIGGKRPKVLTRAKGKTARAVQFDEALAMIPGLQNYACPIPGLIIVVSVLDEDAGPYGEGGSGP